MVLAEAEAVPDLCERLNRLFYERAGLPSGVNVCTPSAGSSLLRIKTETA